MAESDITLKAIERLVTQHSEAGLWRMPILESESKFKGFAQFTGGLLGKPLTLLPGEDREILRWEDFPAHMGTTILCVTMPDATLPHVMEVVDFDRLGDTYNWSIEEYNTLIGLGPYDPAFAGRNVPPFANYGGCTKYLAATFQYASMTDWDYIIKDYLQIRLWNGTAVPVAIDALVIEWWSSGDYRYLKLRP